MIKLYVEYIYLDDFNLIYLLFLASNKCIFEKEQRF